jgi:hypothetical protein
LGTVEAPDQREAYRLAIEKFDVPIERQKRLFHCPAEIAFTRDALVRLVRAPDAILEFAIALGQFHCHQVGSVRRRDRSFVMKAHAVTDRELMGHSGNPSSFEGTLPACVAKLVTDQARSIRKVR